MKQTIYNILILCFILGATSKLKAQDDVQCDRNFTIKADITASTCMANGMIVVTLEGDLSNLDMAKAEYGLEPAAGYTGTKLLPSTGNILRGIAAGTYTINVRTFCKVGDKFGKVKELLNVTVGGNYKPLMADFDQARSRNSYLNCATGIIAFNVTNNTGYGDLKFYIAEAPTGVSKGEVFPTKGTVSGNYTPYTLPDMYLPGQYQIEVDDDCGKSTILFTIGEVVGLPGNGYFGGYTYYSLHRPNELGENCNKVRWYPSYYTPNYSVNSDHFRYYQEKMYEVTLLPTGQAPVESDWVTWTYDALDITLPAGYNDYRAPNGSLTAHLRVKGCNQHAISYNWSIPNPRLSNSSSSGALRYCDNFTFTLTNWQDYYNFWCYPLNVKVTNTTDNIEVHNITVPGPATNLTLEGKYLKQHNILITGADGVTFTSSINVPYPTITVNTPLTYKCDTFTGNFSIYQGYNWRCFPVVVDVYRLKDGGHANNENDFTYVEQLTFIGSGSNSYSKSIEYPHGYYKFVGTFENFKKADGTAYTHTFTINGTSDRPTEYTLGTSSHEQCVEDLLSLYVRSSKPSTSSRFPANTTFTVVEAPEGYARLNVPYKYGYSATGVAFHSTHTPAGKYKVKIEDGCGVPIFVEADLKGGYSARNTSFVIEKDGCTGERLKLKGFVTNAGLDQPHYTYYKILSGPVGFDPVAKPYTGSILLASDGEYVVGVTTSMTQNCYLKRETVNFVKSKPTLDPTVTSSYVCTDRTEGFIIVKGQGGTAPYTYELLDSNKLRTGEVATLQPDGRSVFDYGVAGERFFVRITDGCGNQNDQEVTLNDLKTQKIIYNTPPSGEYCVGDEIKLHCVTLGETTYRWDGPNDYISTSQHPVLSPATEAMSGYYTVSVMPEFCGLSVTDRLYIRVFPELVAGVTSPNQEVCAGTHPTTMNCAVTGGRGLLQYQWQKSTDLTNWVDVSGANSATYTPPIAAQTGTYYYRLQISDECKIVSGSPITLEVKPCSIIVNPSIRSKVSQ